MSRYLTAQGYRAIGLGVDLSSTLDATLDQHIITASALVNATCAAPPDHDFRGGTVTSEPHEWDLGNKYRPPSNRVYPFHRPINAVTQLSIEMSNTPSVTLDAGKLYVEPIQGYIEPISLVVTTIGIIPLSAVPLIGLRKPVAKVDYSYGWNFTASDEPLSTQSGSALRGANQFWFTDEDVILKKNGSIVTGGNYSVNYTEGTITPTSYDPTALYTATYHYPLPPAIAQATAIVMSDLIGYSNINASGLSGLSGIRVEEIELRQSSRAGFIAVPVSAAAQVLLGPYRYTTLLHS